MTIKVLFDKLMIFRRLNSLERAVYTLIGRVNQLQADIRNMEAMLEHTSGNKLRSYQQAIKRIKLNDKQR